jgi:hypothetical protein
VEQHFGSICSDHTTWQHTNWWAFLKNSAYGKYYLVFHSWLQSFEDRGGKAEVKFAEGACI